MSSLRDWQLPVQTLPFCGAFLLGQAEASLHAEPTSEPCPTTLGEVTEFAGTGGMCFWHCQSLIPEEAVPFDSSVFLCKKGAGAERGQR